MKNFLFVVAVLFTFSSCVVGQKQAASPKIEAASENAKVAYGAPYKKGRQIFGGLVPYDEVWRTGANNATEISFTKDALVAGVPIKAGVYTLFTIPRKAGHDWTVILNPTLGQWGAYGYDKIKDKDLPFIAARSSQTDEAVEQFTIAFEGEDLILSWENTKVLVPIKY